jgi:hypothetical protein
LTATTTASTPAYVAGDDDDRLEAAAAEPRGEIGGSGEVVGDGTYQHGGPLGGGWALGAADASSGASTVYVTIWCDV